MRVNALDHVNISTSDVEATARFYADVLGLDPRSPAVAMAPGQGRWLFDQGDHPIIHLRKFEAGSDSTGPIHHVALACSGMAEIIERLTRLKIAHQVNDGHYEGLRQVFLKDPNGVLLELNFAGD